MKAALARSAALLGCAAVGITFVGILVAQLGGSLPWIVGASLVVLWVADGIRNWRLRVLARRFREANSGKDVLIVYTSSPHWLPRIESIWMTRWGRRAVFLNRSAQWSRKQPESQLWAALAGLTDHTPVVVLAPAKGQPKTVRFFGAFRDFKHGNEAALLRAEAAVDAELAGIDSMGA